jgi:hypothetical protein
MVYIIAMLVYFGVAEPHYSVYQGIIFSNMENCQQYVEKNKLEMSHELWKKHKEAQINNKPHKLNTFLIDCIEEEPDPSWKEV